MMALFSLDEEPQHDESLGRYLERKRKERGLSLEEISQETRIGIAFLESIDRGEYHNIPGLPYARGFIRAYGACIGIDPGELEKRLEAEAGLKTS